MSDFDGIIPENSEWTNVPSLSTSAQALGGSNGIGPMNAQAEALVKRTGYLFNYSIKYHDLVNFRVGLKLTGSPVSDFQIGGSKPTIFLSTNSSLNASGIAFSEISFGSTAYTSPIGQSRIEGMTEGAWNAGSTPSGIAISTTATGSTTPTRNFFFGGNGGFGIGIEPTQASFHIRNTTLSSRAIQFDGPSGASSWMSSENSSNSVAGARINFTLNSSSGEFSIANTATTLIYANRSGNLGVQTSNPRISFQMSDIGGLNTRSSVVDLISNAYLDGATWRKLKSGFSTLIELSDANGTMRFLRAASGSANAAITWNESFRVSDAGNFGIGTTVPTQRLHVSGNSIVSGNSMFGDVNFFAGLDTGNPQIAYDSGDSISYDRVANEFRFRINGTLRLKINATEGPARTNDATTADGLPRKSQVEAGITSNVPVGTILAIADLSSIDGFLLIDGKTIGSSSSGATSRANNDTLSLYRKLWAFTSIPIFTSAGAPTTRGASADADFAANKRIALFTPDGGAFIRMWAPGQTRDSGREACSVQEDAIRNIQAEFNINDRGGTNPTGAMSSIGIVGNGGGDGGWGRIRVRFNAANVVPTASENRVYNLAIPHYIKYKTVEI